MSGHMDNPLNYIYRRDPSIVAREIAGEMILVPIRQNVGDLESIFLLNETALFVWQLLDGLHTLSDIRTQMTTEFEVDTQQAEQDLLELIADLEKVGAVIKADG